MEQVFVVACAQFFAGQWPQGFCSAAELEPGLLDRFVDAGRFVDRDAAEQDPAYKQLIPYCVIRRPGAVFCVQRRTAQTETRLHGRLSIGIGGHVNPDPAIEKARGEAFFRGALQRELDEELSGLGDTPPTFLGLLNDDGNAVGRVHAGLVFAIDWPHNAPGSQAPKVREISMMTGGFRHLAELNPLWQDRDRFESWSRILIQAGIAGPTAVPRVARPIPAPPERSSREELTND